MPSKNNFKHPYDTPISSGLRFATELIAWIAGPWAAAQQSKWLIAPALLILIGLPAVFSTPGDKNHIVVATPGPARVVIELLLSAVAAIAPWFVWPTVWAAVATGIVILSIATGIPRLSWLLGRNDPIHPDLN